MAIFLLVALALAAAHQRREILGETHDFAITKYLKARPYPSVEAFRSVVKGLAQVNPKAKDQDPGPSTTARSFKNWIKAASAMRCTAETIGQRECAQRRSVKSRLTKVHELTFFTKSS